MNNRIAKLFASGKKDLLTVYFTAGYPKLDDTVGIAAGLERGGADMIEIGIPFSDPVADGPTIQASNKVALENGMTLALLIDQVSEIRRRVHVPIILMGYLNPVMQYGMDRFVKDATAAGVDGVILPDLPLYDYEEHYRSLFQQHNLSISFLVAPTTTEERIRKIDELTTGFIYAVSSSSITGAKGDFSDLQLSYFKRLSTMRLNNDILIGFGISTAKAFRQATSIVRGAIVGSAFIDRIQKSNDLEQDIKTFVANLKGEQQ